MSKQQRREALDTRIRAAWDAFDDDISTERLLQMVADACGCDTYRVAAGLQRTAQESTR
jgi:hypothetical protein